MTGDASGAPPPAGVPHASQSPSGAAVPDRPPTDPFAARTPWTPDAAIAYAIFALLVSVAGSVLLQAVSFRVSRWFFGGPGAMPGDHVSLANTMLTTLVLEAIVTLLVLWGAGRGGGIRRTVLSLQGRLPIGTFLWGLGWLAALVVPINLTKLLLSPETFAADLRMFAAYQGSPALWLAVLVVVVGAPVSEELLLRGFLLPALTKMRRGFWAATVASTTGWTILHFNYSLSGLVEVFLIGMLFCWLVRRTGNLWLTITLHAFYNGIQIAGLALWPVRLAP